MTKNDEAVTGEITAPSNELVQVLHENELEGEKAQYLLQSYGTFFEKAKDLTMGVYEIKVEDENDIEGMVNAKTKRKELQRLRLDLDEVRKSLKAQALREGRAIDGAANIIKALIVPAEEHLESQEKYIERIQEERKKLLIESRATKLEVLGVEDPTNLYTLGDMSEGAFESLLNTHKLAREAQLKAEKEAEDKRKAEEEAKAKELEDARKENEALKAKLVEEAEAKAKADAEKEAELQAERDKQKELEDKLKAKQEAEEEAKRLEDAKKKADEEAQRQALLAPDKDKLINFAGELQKITMPRVESKEAGALLDNAETRLKELAEYLIQGAKTL